MARLGRVDDKNWQARMDLETLMEACRIKKDKKRMEAVKKEAKKRKTELADQIGSVSEFEESDD